MNAKNKDLVLSSSKSNDTNDDGDVEIVGFQILSMSNKNRLINGNGKSKMKENVIDLSFGSSGSDIVSAEDDGSNMKRVTLETVKRNEKTRCKENKNAKVDNVDALKMVKVCEQ